MKNLNDLICIVRELIDQLKSERKCSDSEEPITIDIAAEFLKKSRQDCYLLISSKASDPLPHHRKGHKTIYFFRSELTAWVKRRKDSSASDEGNNNRSNS